MNSTGSNIAISPTAISTTNTTNIAGTAGTAEQLSLLSSPSVPLQFRLDERTRRSGLQHIAELRAMMAAQAASRRNDTRGRSAQAAATKASQRSVAA